MKNICHHYWDESPDNFEHVKCITCKRNIEGWELANQLQEAIFWAHSILEDICSWYETEEMHGELPRKTEEQLLQMSGYSNPLDATFSKNSE